MFRTNESIGFDAATWIRSTLPVLAALSTLISGSFAVARQCSPINSVISPPPNAVFAVGHEFNVEFAFGAGQIPIGGNMSVASITLNLDCVDQIACPVCADEGNIIDFIGVVGITCDRDIVVTSSSNTRTLTFVTTGTNTPNPLVFTDPPESCTLTYRLRVNNLGVDATPKLVISTLEFVGDCSSGSDTLICHSIPISVVRPDIEINKSACPSLVCADGENVTYTYVVTTGNGNAPLSNVFVTDDHCGPVIPVIQGNGNNIGDVNQNSILEPTEAWNFQCTALITQTTTSIATASGTWIADGQIVPVADSDDTTVSVVSVNSIAGSCQTTYIAQANDPSCLGHSCVWAGPDGFTFNGCELTLDAIDAAGQYCVTVTCGPGEPACEPRAATCCIEFLPPSSPVVTVFAQPTCLGGNGTLTAVIAGGLAPYTVQWFHGAVPIGNPCTGIQNGGTCQLPIIPVPNVTYRVQAVGDNGCEGMDEGLMKACCTVEVNPQNAVSCSATPNVTITATPSNGTAPYSFAWTGPGGFTAATQQITVNLPGSYCVNVTDATSCYSPTQCATVTAAPSPTSSQIFLPSGQPVCGSITNTATVFANGGTPPYSYSWNLIGSGWLITGGQGSNTISFTAGQFGTTGSFYVTVTDQNGCAVTSSATNVLPDCGAGCGQPQIVPADTAANQNFASSVAMAGNLAVIGAPLDDSHGIDAGAAYVYRRLNSANWQLVVKLYSSDGQSGDHFGSSVAINSAADTIIVGAPTDEVHPFNFSENSGTAYLFRLQFGNWVQTQRINHFSSSPGDEFGSAVAADGDTVLVGTPQDDDAGPASGSVHVFKRTGEAWNPQAFIIPPGATNNYLVGSSVALSGEFALIGARVLGGNSTTYAAHRTGTSWSVDQALLGGDAVAMHGDLAVVARTAQASPAGITGAVWVHRRVGFGYVAASPLLYPPIEGHSGDEFGHSVAMWNGHLLIGSWKDDIPQTDAGSAYLFREVAPNNWTFVRRIRAADATANALYGSSMAVSGGVALIGAPQDSGAGPLFDAGSAYTIGVSQSDCNANSVSDPCDVAMGTSTDANGNINPDECDGSGTQTTIVDLDSGETSVFTPGGGGNLDPAQSAVVSFTNSSPVPDASVTAAVAPGPLHPGAGGYAVFDTQLTITTTLADGQFFMRVLIPFDAADLQGMNPLSVNLVYFDAVSGNWQLAVEANTVNSPGHPGPIGDRFIMQGAISPPLNVLSAQLGDYGVFWNPPMGRGFAWANVDHTTDFAAGISMCRADLSPQPAGDGVVNINDLLAVIAAWGTCPGQCPPSCPGDVAPTPPDCMINVADLLAVIAAWGPCP